MESPEAGKERIAALILGLVPLVHRTFGSSMEKGHAGTECTRSQMKALQILEKRGPMLPSEIGEFLDMRRGSLTTLVDSLEALDFVRREPDGDDRRRIWIRLTERGKNFIRERYRVIHADVALKMGELGPEEQERMERELSDVIDILNKLAPRFHGCAKAKSLRRSSGDGTD